MRMRARNHLEERMENCKDIWIKNGEGMLILPTPLYIEIGCGKGSFICKSAERNPDINFIAMEKVSNIIVLAMEKAKNMALKNVQFIVGDFSITQERFPDCSVDRIYLNFSDPWPKKGYAKRRLTHSRFLSLYKRVLKENGEIHLKTDNKDFFDFSIESFRENGFNLSQITYDLHNSNFEGNIMTEYETKFFEEGKSICRLVATVNK